jgi:hypothetical protein
MGETSLVEGKIDDAIQLINKLDASGDRPTKVVWYFYDDADNWRLLIAGPTFDALLPKNEAIAYRKLVEVINNLSLGALSVSDLKLLKTDTPLLRSVGMIIGTGPESIVRAHFTDTTINGIFIQEMYVLRSA